MSEPTEPTDFQRAANVARYIQIEEVVLTNLNSRLLVDRSYALSKIPWGISIEKTVEFSFNEETKRLKANITLRGNVASNAENAVKEPLIEFSCTFCLGYTFDALGGPTGEERDKYLKAFAVVNGVFNCWPYFRELFQSMVARMGLPPVVLPVYRPSEN